MNSDLLLSLVAALTGFVLKTTLAFVICLIINRLVDSPNSKFIIWLGFLYGAGAYWLWLAKGFLPGRPAAELSGTFAQPSMGSVSSAAAAWQVPGSWAFPLGIGLRVAGIVYLLVLSYILFAHIKRQRQMRWVLGFSSKPPDEIAQAFQLIAGKLRVGRARLLVLSGVTSPATFGWIRPTILLPDICLEQDRSDLEDILLHELQHVRRRDFVWNGFALACRALLFFHPAAWYALRKMQFDRELACDLAVVSQSPGRRAKYAECLTRFARLNLSQDPRTWGVDFAASSQHLKVRVQSILAGSKKTSVWLVGLRTAFATALLTAFLVIAPSLAVMLSFTHRQMLQPQMSPPLASTTHDSFSGSETRRRAARRLRSLPPSASASADAAIANPILPETSQFSQVEPEPARGNAQDTSATSKLVPGLIRRYLPPGAPGAASNARSTQQSVTLIDTGSAGQVGKANREGSKTLQQSILLLGGIYRRLGDVKPDR